MTIDPATMLVLAYLNRSAALHGLGYVSRADVDLAMRLGCGLPAGPLEQLEQIGLDKAVALLEAAGIEPAPLLRTWAERGRGVDAGEHPAPAASVGSAGSTGSAGDAAGEVRRVAVVGSGVMARGIAQVAAAGGLPTTLVARTPERAASAADGVADALARQVARGRMTGESRTAVLDRLACTTVMAEVAGADVVIEAVVEALPAKAGVFAELGELCGAGTILATTTSSLPVQVCADASGRPADVVGMHFFNPAPAMKLVEVSRTPVTADRVVATARDLAKRLGKVPVVCADRAGFIVNYLLFGYLNDAIGLADDGLLTHAELDAEITRRYGYPMGPFKLLDTIGLDVSLAILGRLNEVFAGPEFRVRKSLEDRVTAGQLGRKSGRGFLPWPPGGH
jgi:3-hydroxybutyryl-CoA dehydrogenase